MALRSTRKGRTPATGGLVGRLRDALASGVDPADGEALREALRGFRDRTGLRLVHDPDDCDGRQRTPARPEDVLRLLPTVRDLVATYPEPIRGHLLKRVHVYGTFQMNGKPYLGAARAKMRRIDLGFRKRTPPGRLATTVHHEIAHLVEAVDGFPREDWVAISGKGAYTGKGHRDAWGKGSADELLEAGFVSRYASKNPHEDFAELAEIAFTQPERIRKMARRRERLGRKLRMLEDWYRHLAPEMDFPWRDGGPAPTKAGPDRRRPAGRRGAGRRGGERGRGRG